MITFKKNLLQFPQFYVKLKLAFNTVFQFKQYSGIRDTELTLSIETAKLLSII